MVSSAGSMNPTNRRGALTDNGFANQVRSDLRAAAIQLFVEALGIERVSGSGNTGQNRQGDDGGQNGLHDQISQ